MCLFKGGEIMYIITDSSDSRVINYGAKLDYLSNGYPRLIDENVAFILDMVNVYEVTEIPQEVESEKWCYTEADGFYPNPNWHEPSAYDLAPHDVVDAIIDEYTNELIEMGVL